MKNYVFILGLCTCLSIVTSDHDVESGHSIFNRKPSVIVGDRTGDIMRSIQIFFGALSAMGQRLTEITAQPLDGEDVHQIGVTFCGCIRRDEK